MAAGRVETAAGPTESAAGAVRAATGAARISAGDTAGAGGLQWGRKEFRHGPRQGGHCVVGTHR